MHGRHFTFKDANGDAAITMVTEGIDGSYADEEHPFAAKGPWLHIFLKQAFVTKMIEDIDKADKVSMNLTVSFYLKILRKNYVNSVHVVDAYWTALITMGQ